MNHLEKCRKKDCKWCLVFKNAPQHMGANCLISNEILVKDIDVQKIKARYGSFDKLRVDGSPVSLGTETIRKWIMPNLNNKTFKSSMDIIDLDKLYYGSKKSLDGSVYFDLFAFMYLKKSFNNHFLGTNEVAGKVEIDCEADSPVPRSNCSDVTKDGQKKLQTG